MIKNNFTLGILSLGLFLTGSCTNPQAAPRTTEFTPRVTLTAVEQRSVAQEIQSFGSLSFQKKVDISAAMEGTVERIYVEEGDFVSGRQLLADLENVQLDIQKQQAETALGSALSGLGLSQAKLDESRMGVEGRFLNMEKAQLQLEQVSRNITQEEESLNKKRELFEVGGITQDALDTAENTYRDALDQKEALEKEIQIMEIGLRDKDLTNRGFAVPENPEAKIAALVNINTLTEQAEYAVAQSQVTGARRSLQSVNLLLEELRIRSPFQGIVGARTIEVGQRVKEADPLFTIFDSSQVFVIFSVKESQGSLIEKGQIMEVMLDALPDQLFRGQVEIVSPIVDPQTGNITVKGLLSNRGNILKPGMFARVSIKVSQPQPAIVVHKEAIVDRIDQDAHVFQYRSGRTFKIPVTILQTLEEAFVVDGEINPGDQLILAPSPLIKEGINVEISP
jgi:HlyD family secretion protein